MKAIYPVILTAAVFAIGATGNLMADWRYGNNAQGSGQSYDRQQAEQQKKQIPGQMKGQNRNADKRQKSSADGRRSPSGQNPWGGYQWPGN